MDILINIVLPLIKAGRKSGLILCEDRLICIFSRRETRYDDNIVPISPAKLGIIFVVIFSILKNIQKLQYSQNHTSCM